MKPLNFLDNKVVRKKIIFNKEILLYILPTTFVFIFLIFDFFTLKKNVNLIGNDLQEYSLLVESCSQNRFDTEENKEDLLYFIDEYNKYLNSNVTLDMLIEYLEEVTDESIFITSLEYNYPLITINGISSSEADINNLLSKLLDVTGDLEITSLNYSEDIYSFIIEGELNGFKDV